MAGDEQRSRGLGSEAAAALGQVGCLYFDFRGAGQAAVWFIDPVRVLVARTPEEVPGVLAQVDAAVREGHYAAGYVAYEAAPAFDPAFSVHPPGDLPLAWFGLYERPLPARDVAVPGDYELSAWHSLTDPATYEAHICRIRDAIARGETYQVNYTIRLRAHFRGHPFALFQDLQRAQRGGYAAYLGLGRFHILSASPEMFFRLQDGVLETRPMKGTIPRGRWYEEDCARRAQLAQSEKDRAENVMIVDLLRNDIGRIAAIGSVTVDPLFAVEAYPTVYQMTSTVRGNIGDKGIEDVFAALFPCGSITGAPKIQTMRIIRDLEGPRGVYCGAIGYVAPGGRAVFNVAIRTVVIDMQEGVAEYGTGSGVTWGSHPRGEYAETLAKAQILTTRWPAFSLRETMRLERGKYALLDRHMRRLQQSAEYFGFPMHRTQVEAKLAELARRHTLCPPVYVRLTLHENGEVQLETSPLPPTPAEPVPVAWADTPVDTDLVFLYHKTTWRAPYDQVRAKRPDVFDVLMWNSAGEVTEFTIGNVIAEIDGVCWTPPVECGLLPGTLRAELIAQGRVSERRLTRADIERATRLWLANSVRGMVPVRLVQP